MTQDAEIRERGGDMAPEARPGTRRGLRIILTASAVLLVLYGMKGALLSRVGSETTATITAVDQQRRTPRDAEYNYSVAYRFTLPNDKRILGSAYRTDIERESAAPKVGDAMPVRYLRVLPGINAPSDLCRLSFGSYVVFALAGVLLWCAFFKHV